MKTKLLLTAFGLLLAAPAFASDRGPQRDQAQRLTQVERTPQASSNGASDVEMTAPAPHHHMGSAEHRAKAGGEMCGCASREHAHS
jgi:hypothetical protein